MRPLKINIGLLVGLFLLALGSAFDGTVEGYGFDGRLSFERKYGVDPYGFFGSQSWRMVYVDNEPGQGFKSPFWKWLGAFDFYHMADDGRKYGYIIGGVLTGFCLLRLKRGWRVALLLSVWLFCALIKAGSMNLVRFDSLFG
jgi:hypothetical protein